MTFLLVNGALAADAGLNEIQTGMWLEQAVSRHLTFEEFAERLRERLSHS